MRQNLTDYVAVQDRRLDNIVTLAREGGITGVGGGGDPQVALFKPSMIALLINSPGVFVDYCGGQENLANIARYILHMRIETDEVFRANRVATGYPGIYFAYDANVFFLQVDKTIWPYLRGLREAGLSARTGFITLLVKTACTMQMTL